METMKESLSDISAALDLNYEHEIQTMFGIERNLQSLKIWWDKLITPEKSIPR